jgi:hypothetical protein
LEEVNNTVATMPIRAIGIPMSVKIASFDQEEAAVLLVVGVETLVGGGRAGIICAAARLANIVRPMPWI